MLTDAGFNVVSEASDGAEAVEKFTETSPALVLMDIYMSAISGIEATKEIIAINPSAKIIICSGTGYDEDISAALAVGAKAVIFKPFYDEEVLETVRNILASRAMIIDSLSNAKPILLDLVHCLL